MKFDFLCECGERKIYYRFEKFYVLFVGKLHYKSLIHEDSKRLNIPRESTVPRYTLLNRISH